MATLTATHCSVARTSIAEVRSGNDSARNSLMPYTSDAPRLCNLNLAQKARQARSAAVRRHSGSSSATSERSTAYVAGSDVSNRARMWALALWTNGSASASSSEGVRKYFMAYCAPIH